MRYESQHIAPHRVFQDSKGIRFCFLCEVSGAAICTTRPLPLQPTEIALEKAWTTEGRRYFNRCQKCGKWVSDVMYNPNTLKCVQCSPWEEKSTFCPKCGENVLKDEIFCYRCGCRLQYGEEENDGSA